MWVPTGRPWFPGSPLTPSLLLSAPGSPCVRKHKYPERWSPQRGDQDNITPYSPSHGGVVFLPVGQTSKVELGCGAGP